MNKEYKEIKTTITEEEANEMIEKVAHFFVDRSLGSAGIMLLNPSSFAWDCKSGSLFYSSFCRNDF